MAYIYILRCENDELYVGSTIDINDRVVRHKSGRGAVYTKHHKPEELIYTEEYNTYQEAFKREKQIKGWSRALILVIYKNLNSFQNQRSNAATS